MKRHGPFFKTPSKITDIRFAAQTASSRRSLVPILHFSRAEGTDVSSKCGVWRAVPIVERAIKVLLARRSRPFDISETHFIGGGKKRPYVSRERRTVMTKFGLIGAAALSLLLATPAMAMHRHHHHYRYSHAYDRSWVGGADPSLHPSGS
jgi:hypothetical protein